MAQRKPDKFTRADLIEKAKPITPKDVESYISKQDTSELVRIIMKQADIDDDFYAILKMRVATENAGSNTSEIRNVLCEAMTIHDFVSWRDTGNYMRSIDSVIDQIRTMLTSKQAAQVVEVAEYGMDLWETFSMRHNLNLSRPYAFELLGRNSSPDSSQLWQRIPGNKGTDSSHRE